MATRKSVIAKPKAKAAPKQYITVSKAPKAKTAKVTTDGSIAKELIPRDSDTGYVGDEPGFAVQPVEAARLGLMSKAFGWYNRFFGKKNAKEFMIDYLSNAGRKNDADALRKVQEQDFILTYGWLARMRLRGLELNATETAKFDAEVARLILPIVEVKSAIKAERIMTDKVSNKPNIQDIMRERAMEAGGQLEGMFDDFITAGAKGTPVPNVVGTLTEYKIMPQHVPLLVEVWKNRITELQEAIDGSDKQLVEGYSQYTKTGLKNLVKFCEAVLAGLESYITVKRATRQPRKRKPVSPERQAGKLKFLKEFPELGLISIPPAKIIGATEVWAYDTAKRKIHYYVADSMIGSMAIKGTTILGFDALNSGIKTLRKPAEFLKSLMSAGKPSARKLFKDVNAVQAKPNGRTNESLIILKAY
jgi:hypothetical protein